MQVLVKKCGDSASVRIPAAVMEAAGLSLDHPVDIREDRHRHGPRHCLLHRFGRLAGQRMV
jgi:hypothetical protein